MSHRPCAILEFDTGQLRHMLQLPETAEIVAAEVEFGVRGRILLKIEGAGFPVKEGELVPRTTCLITQTFLGDRTELREKITWPFDEMWGQIPEQETQG